MSTDQTQAFRLALTRRSRPRKRTYFGDVMLALAVASDFHAPSVAGILSVSRQAVISRWLASALRRPFMHARAAWRAREGREGRKARLRRWWRWRLRRLGIEPTSLPLTDPLWHACNRWPRGEAVRRVAAEMRRERPGESLATPERLAELVERAMLVQRELDPPPAPRD